MAKIKGWKRDAGKDQWFNIMNWYRKDERRVNYLDIEAYPQFRPNKYEVVLTESLEGFDNSSIMWKPKTLKIFKTKKEAVDYAIKYMRANPDG